MSYGAVGRFTEASDYQESIKELTIELVVTRPGPFDAKLIWAKLPHIFLLRAEEVLARVACIALPPRSISVWFCTALGRPVWWNGAELRYGELVIHRPGERLHQRTIGANNWGLLSVLPDFLSTYGGALLGQTHILPQHGAILHPPRPAFTRLMKLHARVAAAVERMPETIAAPEAARSMEQDLLYELVGCMAAGGERIPSHSPQRHADIMARFENLIAKSPGRSSSVKDLCAECAVSERTFRALCLQFLGMGPCAYMRLKRLMFVRSEIIRGDPSPSRIGEIARRFDFREMGQFSAAYRDAFGETPSATLRHARDSLK